MGPDPRQQVCYTLYSTSNLITQAYRSLLVPLNLTYPQFVVMMVLWQKDGVSVSHLAAAIGLSKPTMTPMLKRLELQNYITREYDQEDERQKRISLTEKGRKLVVKGSDAAKQALCATGLDDEEVEQIILLCQKIKNNLK